MQSNWKYSVVIENALNILITTFYGLNHESGCNFTPTPSGRKIRYNVRFRKVKEKVPKMSMDPIMKMLHNSDEKNHKVDDLALRSLP